MAVLFKSCLSLTVIVKYQEDTINPDIDQLECLLVCHYNLSLVYKCATDIPKLYINSTNFCANR